MEANKPGTPCEFDRLFTKSVPHILEGIFFSLDYDSFMKCRMVCKAWNELHSSELYQKKAEILLEEKKKYENELWQYSRDGEVEKVRNLLQKGVNPNCEVSVSRPLCVATMRGYKDVVRFSYLKKLFLLCFLLYIW